MSKFIRQLFLSYHNPAGVGEKPLFTDCATSAALEDRLDAFAEIAGLDCQWRDELDELIYEFCMKHEENAFEQGFKLGMKTATASLFEPNAVKRAE